MEASAAPAPAGLGRVSVKGSLLRLRSDDQLLAQFRAGNEDAFAVIHDRYRVRLGAYARRMLSGSEADAEDVLQDVFLRAYRALRADERPVSLRAWLYRVAHNRCIDQIRRPTADAADVLDASRTPGHDPCAVTEQRERLRRLVADLRRLPDQQRSALVMREIDGMSYQELAGALDTTVPAIKSLLVRARVGLVEAAVSRDADCELIRRDLADAHERGVRASGRACRHTRDCGACAGYRRGLVATDRGLQALSGAPFGLAKLLGLGAASSASVSAGGGGSAVLGGATVGIGKITAILCCAAAVSGSAIEARHALPARDRTPAPQIATPNRSQAASAKRASPAAAAEPATPRLTEHTAGTAIAEASGGALAPAALARVQPTASALSLVDPATAPAPYPAPSPEIGGTPTSSVTAGADAPASATPLADPATAAQPPAGSGGAAAEPAPTA